MWDRFLLHIRSLSDFDGALKMLCMDCKNDSSSEQSLDHHQIIKSSAPYQILMVLYNVVQVNIAKGTTDPGVDCFDQ